MENFGPGERGVVGRITFEATTVSVRDVLAFNDGFRWGAYLLVGGIQIEEDRVAEALRRSPFEPSESEWFAAHSRCAWAAGRDLDVLAVWADPAEPLLQLVPTE
jgi:hypothetical protein